MRRRVLCVLFLAFIEAVPSGALAATEATVTTLNATAEHDCNGNGVEDAVDIAIGSSWDSNGNGVPDECELAPRG